jgi:peroxiredoxin
MGTLVFGAPALDFHLKGIDGKVHSLADLRGQKATVVVFSCNHCPYVRAYEDRLIAIQRDYYNKGVRFIFINSNDDQKYPDDGFEKMIERAQQKGYNFPYLRDESQETAHAYGAERTPEIFLFDQNLKLCYHGTIDDNWEKPEKVTRHYLREALDAVLRGQEPTIKETAPVGCTIKWK